MASPPRLETITPWRLCRKVLAEVGQPTAGDAQRLRWLPPCTKAKNKWMNTGAQDWTMSDAAHAILVLTKTDGEPTSLTPVGNSADSFLSV